MVKIFSVALLGLIAASANAAPILNKRNPAPAPIPQTSGFALANGQAAQALNAKFATLTKGSPCTVGENACVEGEFAQCPPGADGNNVFVTTPCNGLTCAALPLVNSPGTSITCTTPADALTRIANTGATGGLTG